MLLIKENLSLVCMMFGFWGLFSKDRDRISWGAAPLVVSFVYFLIVIKLIIPSFRGIQQHSMWGRYEHLGANPKEIIFNLLQIKTWTAVFTSPLNLNYLFSLFGLLMTPALFGFRILILVAPIILYHLLSNYAPEKTIYYYYALLVTPAIFLASTKTLSRFCSKKYLCTAICAFLLMGSLWQLYVLSPKLAFKIGFDRKAQVVDYWGLVDMIPPDAATIATFDFMPALSLREHLYSFHKVFDRSYQDMAYMIKSDFNVGSAFQVPPYVKYAIINFSNPWLQLSLNRDQIFVRHKLEVFFKDWHKIASVGSAALYQRNVK